MAQEHKIIHWKHSQKSSLLCYNLQRQLRTAVTGNDQLVHRTPTKGAANQNRDMSRSLISRGSDCRKIIQSIHTKCTSIKRKRGKGKGHTFTSHHLKPFFFSKLQLYKCYKFKLNLSDVANIFKAVGSYIDVSVERKQKKTLPAGACSRVKTITSSQDIKKKQFPSIVSCSDPVSSLLSQNYMFQCRQLQVVFSSGCDLTVTVTLRQRQSELSHLKDLRL